MNNNKDFICFMFLKTFQIELWHYYIRHIGQQIIGLPYIFICLRSSQATILLSHNIKHRLVLLFPRQYVFRVQYYEQRVGLAILKFYLQPSLLPC